MGRLDDILENLMSDVVKDGYFAWSTTRTARKLISQHANRKQEVKDLFIDIAHKLSLELKGDIPYDKLVKEIEKL